MSVGKIIPDDIIFHIRVRDESIGGENPFKWTSSSTKDYFANKRVIIFSLPGAFTPTCSTYQLPGFEEHYDEILSQNIDEIYCVSVNDSYVMNKWVIDQGVKKVKVIPDGSGKLTSEMNMLVAKDDVGFGMRSWRYAALINDSKVEKIWEEAGKMDNCPDDPYEETDPTKILADIKI